ncbi:MAG: hypothetical protein CM1200mP41_26480 [Gammaproteobacteria bacterium]|nr:MAG: hypothetical protein CM1200mP41_26480 [Gammaproteobacteria bacterium]
MFRFQSTRFSIGSVGLWVNGERIEIRGFGSISLRYREPRLGRNPKTGEPVSVPGKYVPLFKPGRFLRERVNRLLGLTGKRNRY